MIRQVIQSPQKEFRVFFFSLFCLFTFRFTRFLVRRGWAEEQALRFPAAIFRRLSRAIVGAPVPLAVPASPPRNVVMGGPTVVMRRNAPCFASAGRRRAVRLLAECQGQETALGTGRSCLPGHAPWTCTTRCHFSGASDHVVGPGVGWRAWTSPPSDRTEVISSSLPCWEEARPAADLWLFVSLASPLPQNISSAGREAVGRFRIGQT